MTQPTIPPPPSRLLVFARVPEKGSVKTRLAADLGDEKALDAYEAMLGDLLDSIGPPSDELAIEVLWAPTAIANGALLRRAFGDRQLSMQTGATLGDRLAMAFSERFFFQRTMSIIAIGVDDPTLSRETIDHAFSLLDSCEWVIGPAEDGGYYLIGCRAPAFDSSIFRDVEFGSPTVFQESIARIRTWNHTVAVLPLRSDLDVAGDLKRYRAQENRGRLAALLAQWEL